MRMVVAFLLLFGLSARTPLKAQSSQPDQSALPVTPAPQPPPQYQRPVSWGTIIPNIADDQAKIWLFPARIHKNRNWIPTAVILGTTAALIALDPQDASYFRRTSTYSGFNNVFTGHATTIGMVIAPVSLYAGGLIAKDSKMQETALLAAEAIADTELLATVLKDSSKRARPATRPPDGNFSDTWFHSQGSYLRGNGSMPSGHAIAAFALATVVARRYGNHRWVPYVSYGLATLVGFSRITLSAHFVSEVFAGAALGYSVSRFAVLRQ